MDTEHSWAQKLTFPSTAVKTTGFCRLPSLASQALPAYLRKPRDPRGHARRPHRSLYFLQTRLGGREGGQCADGTQTPQTSQTRHGASLPAQSPINQTFLPCPLAPSQHAGLYRSLENNNNNSRFRADEDSVTGPAEAVRLSPNHD